LSRIEVRLALHALARKRQMMKFGSTAGPACTAARREAGRNVLAGEHSTNSSETLTEEELLRTITAAPS